MSFDLNQMLGDLRGPSWQVIMSSTPKRPPINIALDTNARSLLQVKIKEVDEADDIFTKLMGELVELRHEFIQDNALTASVDV